MSTTTSDAFSKRLSRRLFAIVSIALVLSAAVLSFYALNQFEKSLTPELGEKAGMVGLTITDDIERAVKHGIPFDELVGVEPYLENILSRYPELKYIAITETSGKMLYSAGHVTPEKVSFFSSSDRVGGVDADVGANVTTELKDVHDLAVPIENTEMLWGLIHIGVDKYFIQSQLNDVYADLMIILIVAVLVAIEISLALVAFYVTGPISRLRGLMGCYGKGDFSQYIVGQGGDVIGQIAEFLSMKTRQLNDNYKGLLETLSGATTGTANAIQTIGVRYRLGNMNRYFDRDIVDARIPLFIFSFAEELQKSFLPLFVKQVYEPIPYLSQDMVIGLPIALYMLVIAIVTPFAGAWADRFGSRKIFLIGLIPAIAGFIGCGFAGSIYEIILWRSSTAFGYAMITIACQGYIAAIVTRENRAQGMAVFVGVLMSATMCGTAIGGILADRVGFQTVFFLAAVFASVAGVAAWRMLAVDTDAPETEAVTTENKPKGGSFAIFRNNSFVAVLLLAAIPSKIILTGFLYYIVPLYLFKLGSSAAEIGRVMMLYSVIIIFAGPVMSRLVDFVGSIKWSLAIGSCLSGAGMWLFSDWESIWAVLLMVGIMGLAHSITKAPQIAFVMEICERDMAVLGRTAVLGVLRTMERVGSFLGPFMAGLLVSLYGFQQAITIMGILVSVSAVAFGVIFFRSQTPIPEESKS